VQIQEKTELGLTGFRASLGQDPVAGVGEEGTWRVREASGVPWSQGGPWGFSFQVIGFRVWGF